MTNTATQENTVPSLDLLLNASLSPATREAYRKAVESARNHFRRNGWELFPRSVDGGYDAALFLRQTTSYLAALHARGVSLSTGNKSLAALKAEAGRVAPELLPYLSAPVVKQMMTGWARSTSSAQTKKAEALTVSQIRALHTHLTDASTVRAVRDRAMLALGIAAALRSSSIGALTLADISPALTLRGGLRVYLRDSKTDQEGQGYTVPVAAASERLLCPARAVNDWLAVLAATGVSKATHPAHPLFPAVRGDSTVQSDEMKQPYLTITRILRGALVDAGEVSAAAVNAYSSHSLRATFVSLSFAAQVPEQNIQAITGHKSVAVLRGYDRTSLEAAASAAYLEV